MPSQSNPTTVIAELAAVVAFTLAVCFAVDTLGGALGYQPKLFCTALAYTIAGAHDLGSIFIMLGLLVWALSRFKSEAGLTAVIGGYLLTFFPQVIPHYLGVSCIP